MLYFHKFRPLVIGMVHVHALPGMWLFIKVRTVEECCLIYTYRYFVVQSQIYLDVPL